MDFSFSAEDREFQREVRAWLDDAWPEAARERRARSALARVSKAEQVRWQQKLAERGWAAPNWPVEHGGAGFTATQNYIFDLEMARAGAPRVLPFGITMVAPVIMKFGTEEQKQRFLPDILHSRVWWCQGYSEPGSGSDLASLRMKAEDKGDHYLVNGVKTWTTLAKHADWIFCLVRTSTEERRSTRHQLPADRHAIPGRHGQADHHAGPAGGGLSRRSTRCISRTWRCPRPTGSGKRAGAGPAPSTCWSSSVATLTPRPSSSPWLVWRRWPRPSPATVVRH